MIQLHFSSFFLLLLVFSAPVEAKLSQISNLLVNAKSMVRDAERQRVDLRGNVQIIYEDSYLYAEHAVVDLKEKKFTATGKVSILTPTQSIDGDRVEMNYETGKGIIFNGFVQSGAVNFEGDIIRKVGANEYEVENGEYTACKTCPPAWSFSGKRIKAELGGYAHITSPIFRIASYPFFWLPYLIVPLKSRRQTGFLFPSFSSEGDGGATIAQSFFWAIDPHRDVTFTLKSYTNRGLKGRVNYRFFADQDSYGEFDGAFINDSLFPDSDRLTGANGLDSISRWFIDYDHIYQLPDDFVQRAQINLVSDIEYLEDFPTEVEGLYGEPALENRISLAKNTENIHFSAEAAFNINLLKEQAKTDNSDAVHRLPDLQLSWAQNRIAKTDLIGQLDISYTNFARDGFGFDDVTFDSTSSTPKVFNPIRDGEFNFDDITSADQIRAGQRFDIQPRFAYALSLTDYIDVLPAATYRYTRYDFGFGGDPSVDRSYLRTEVSVRSKLEKIYPGESALDNSYKHEIIPELTFTDTPTVSQPNHPFFGTTTEIGNFKEDDFLTDDEFFGENSIQFDYFDRIVDRKNLRLSFTNLLIEKDVSGETPSYRQIALFKISQSYDFIEAEKEDGFPWSNITAIFDLRFPRFGTNTVLNYYPYHKITNVTSSATIRAKSGVYFRLNYTLSHNTGDDIADNDKQTEDIGGRLGFNSEYFDFSGQINYSTPTSKINSWEYTVALKPPGDCWGLVFRHLQNVTGEVNYFFNFSYSFDGKKNYAFNETQNL